MGEITSEQAGLVILALLGLVGIVTLVSLLETQDTRGGDTDVTTTVTTTPNEQVEAEAGALEVNVTGPTSIVRVPLQSRFTRLDSQSVSFEGSLFGPEAVSVGQSQLEANAVSLRLEIPTFPIGSPGNLLVTETPSGFPSVVLETGLAYVCHRGAAAAQVDLSASQGSLAGLAWAVTSVFTAAADVNDALLTKANGTFLVLAGVTGSAVEGRWSSDALAWSPVSGAGLAGATDWADLDVGVDVAANVALLGRDTVAEEYGVLLSTDGGQTFPSAAQTFGTPTSSGSGSVMTLAEGKLVVTYRTTAGAVSAWYFDGATWTNQGFVTLFGAAVEGCAALAVDGRVIVAAVDRDSKTFFLVESTDETAADWLSPVPLQANVETVTSQDPTLFFGARGFPVAVFVRNGRLLAWENTSVSARGTWRGPLVCGHGVGRVSASSLLDQGSATVCLDAENHVSYNFWPSTLPLQYSFQTSSI